MKVGIISPLFEPWLVGGAEKYITTLAQSLVQNHDVFVLTTKGKIPREPDSTFNNIKVIEIDPHNVESLHFMVTTPNVSNSKKLLWHLLNIWNFQAKKQIIRILQLEKPDIVHTNGIKGFSPALFSAIKKLHIPHIHTLNDYELISPWSNLFRNGKPIEHFNFLDKFYINYMRYMSSNIDGVISPSQFLMNFHVNHGFFKKSKQYIIPTAFTTKKEIKFSASKGKEFLYVGQIVEHKGPQIAIKAFKKLTNKDYKLHIVGKGTYLDTIKKIANNDDRIIFHGYVSDNELNKLFLKCSYLIFPSQWKEIFGLVAIEALNNGLPVIGSNLGAIPEIIKNEYNGFLFEAGNIDSLYNILKRVIDGKVMFTKLCENAYESSKKYSLNENVKKIQDIYSATKSSPN